MSGCIIAPDRARFGHLGLYFKIIYKGVNMQYHGIMQQVKKLLIHLKKSLKAKGATYKKIAAALDLSESSVKRLFTGGDLTLERIELICSHFDISFIELCRHVGQEQEENLWLLTHEQERVMARDMRLLQIYSLLHHGKTVSFILATFDIEERELLKLLLTLDKLRLIELHQNNRIKIINKGPYRLNRDGDVGTKIFEQTKKHFMNSEFKKDTEHVRFSSLPFVPHLVQKLKHQMDELIRSYVNETKYIDIEENHEEIGVLMAFRPWKIDDFGDLRPRNKKGHS